MREEQLKGWEISVLDHGYVRLIDWMGSDQRILESARISYRSPSKGEEQDKKLLAYLYKNLHLSPFEQCNITFNIKLPLFVQAQMVRHRTQRLNQVSARYTEMKDEFYIPDVWRKQDLKNKQGSVEDDKWEPSFDQGGIIYEGQEDVKTGIEYICKEIYSIYQSLIESGVSREMARMILPQNLYTEIYSNWDLRNLLNFLRLRDDPHAQFEIKVYAKAIRQMLDKLFPWTMEAYDKYKFKLVEQS